jgi:hypothetical protein
MFPDTDHLSLLLYVHLRESLPNTVNEQNQTQHAEFQICYFWQSLEIL